MVFVVLERSSDETPVVVWPFVGLVVADNSVLQQESAFSPNTAHPEFAKAMEEKPDV